MLQFIRDANQTDHEALNLDYVKQSNFRIPKKHNYVEASIHWYTYTLHSR